MAHDSLTATSEKEFREFLASEDVVDRLLRKQREKYEGMIREKDALILEKDALIREKDALIREKDALIEKFDIEIKRIDSILKQQKGS